MFNKIFRRIILIVKFSLLLTTSSLFSVSCFNREYLKLLPQAEATPAFPDARRLKNDSEFMSLNFYKQTISTDVHVSQDVFGNTMDIFFNEDGSSGLKVETQQGVFKVKEEFVNLNVQVPRLTSTEFYNDGYIFKEGDYYTRSYLKIWLVYEQKLFIFFSKTSNRMREMLIKIGTYPASMLILEIHSWNKLCFLLLNLKTISFK